MFTKKKVNIIFKNGIMNLSLKIKKELIKEQ